MKESTILKDAVKEQIKRNEEYLKRIEEEQIKESAK